MRVYEPKRALYRKEMSKPRTCQFCDKKILKQQGCPSLETAFWHVIVSSYPYLDGNVMIIPKRHVEFVEALSEGEWTNLQFILKKTQSRLGEIFQTKDFNIALNIGKNSGASIKHLHWQVIPRPRVLNQNSLNVMADLHLITLADQDLKKKIENKVENRKRG